MTPRTASFRFNSIDVHMKEQRLGQHTKTCTDLNQIKCQHWEGEVATQNPTLNQEATCYCNCWIRENQFFFFFPMEHHWVYQSHTRAGRKPKSSWLPQNRLAGVCLCFFFFFVLLFGGCCWFVCFYLHFCWIFLLFFLYKKEKDYEVVWVARWEGYGSSQGRENNIIKIYCMRK